MQSRADNNHSLLGAKAIQILPHQLWILLSIGT